MIPSEEKIHLNGNPPMINDVVNAQGVSWRQFRRTLKPRYTVIAGYILLALLMLFGGGTVAMMICRQLSSLWWQLPVIVVAGLWFAFWLAVITAHFHEAAHFHLCKDNKRNDFLASILLTPLVGLEIKSYRKSHWMHHRYLGTPKDTEVSYHRPVTRHNLLMGLSGLLLLKTIFLYARGYKKSSLQALVKAKEDKKGKKDNSFFAFIKALLVVGFSQFIVVLCLILSNNWPLALAWCLSFIIFGPFLSMLKQTMEHRALDARDELDYKVQTHGPVNRMFGTGWLATLYGAAGFNRHLLHHWDPTVSYTCFNQMEAFFLDTPLKDQLLQSKTSYRKIFRELLH